MWLSNHKVEHILIFLCSSTTALSLSLSRHSETFQNPTHSYLFLFFLDEFGFVFLLLLSLFWLELIWLYMLRLFLHQCSYTLSALQELPQNLTLFFLFFLGKSGFFFWCGCLIRKTLNSGRSMEWLNSIFKINGMHTLFYEWLKYKIHYSKMLTSHEQLIRFHA